MTSGSPPCPSAHTATDVVIVGSGAAGTCAAFETGAAGLRTIVLESTDVLGGAAALSGGGCCVAGTDLQASMGIDDDPSLALSDWVRWGGDEVDAAWASRYLEHVRQNVFEWARSMGVRWDRVEWFEGNSVPRWHHPVGDGAELMRRLRRGSRGSPIDWRTKSPVTEIRCADDGSAEVVVDDGRNRFRTSAVVVASGGFTADPSRVAQYGPRLKPGARLLCGGAPGATGGGHDLLAAFDAAFVALDRLWIYPYGLADIRDANAVRGLAVRGIENDVWVDHTGRRFHDERRRGAATATSALLAREHSTCWSIFDCRDAATLTLSDPWFGTSSEPDRLRIDEFLDASPFVHRASTIAGLAVACGLPPGELGQTIDAFNAAVRSGAGIDPEHGRDLSAAREISGAPFWAVQLFPLARKCLGGVRTDESCRVLRADGAPIPGVYAAGEVAGMAGGHINGAAALEGTMLGPSLFSGRVAGVAVASALRGAATKNPGVSAAKLA